MLTACKFLPFPVYLNMAPIEVSLIPKSATATAYWKMNIAALRVSLYPTSNATFSSSVDVHCLESNDHMLNNGGNGDGCFPTNDLLTNRSVEFSTVYTGEKMFLYNFASTLATQASVIQIPSSLAYSNFINNATLSESFLISSSISVMGDSYLNDILDVQYGPKAFAIHLVEGITGLDFTLTGEYLAKKMSLIDTWLVFIIKDIFVCICMYF